ncbi:MAG TPA: hypothetical protein PK648_04195, partial [Verrucomicrobiales bacterium]|nr:hypothetical protein [Verrucomicrobiales bacterium]
ERFGGTEKNKQKLSLLQRAAAAAGITVMAAPLFGAAGCADEAPKVTPKTPSAENSSPDQKAAISTTPGTQKKTDPPHS